MQKVFFAWVLLFLVIEGLAALGTFSTEYRTTKGYQALEILEGQYAVGFNQRITQSSVVAKKSSSIRTHPRREAVGNNIFVIKNAPTRSGRMQATAAMQYDFVYPVYKEKSTGFKIYPRPEVIVQLQSEADVTAFAKRHFLMLVRPIRLAKDQYLFRISSSLNPFEVSNSLWDDPQVIWANPNFVHQMKLHYRPNDEYYPRQWHLNNTGQGGGLSGADVSAEAAWDLVRPNPNLVIAIIDNGVELNHPDLNVFTNEIEARGISGVDDDGNGYVDDVHGWDFMGLDNETEPDPLEDHGTSVAGVAAAIGNNGIGVTGAAYGVQVLPVKILGEYQGEENGESVSVAEGIRYAARYADILNNSWGGPMTDAEYDALTYAASDQAKRGKKGVPVLFATGNNADMYSLLNLDHSMNLSAGNHEIRLVYDKDNAGSFGEDRVLINEIGLSYPVEPIPFSLPFSGKNLSHQDMYVIQEIGIEPGPHTLVFEYKKNSSNSPETDFVSIKEVFVNFNEDLTDYIGLFDFNGELDKGVLLEGDVPFTVESGFFPILQSGDIGDNQTSRVSWSFIVPEGTQMIFLELFFDAETEENGDFFRVSLDNQEISGSYNSQDFPVTLNLFNWISGLHKSAVFGGDQPFRVEEMDDQNQYLVSGKIGDNQTSEVVFPFDLEKDLRVDLAVTFKAETEQNRDFFRIFLDGQELIETFEAEWNYEYSLPFSGVLPENSNPIQGINTHPRVINIGSTNDSDVRSSYSQWGPELMFMAPSDGGQSGIVTTIFSQITMENGFDILAKGYTADFGGTSAATPLASGIMAMIMSAYPEITVEQILQVCRETSVKLGNRSYDSNGYNEEYGHGRLNMAAAVQRAMELKATDVSRWDLY